MSKAKFDAAKELIAEKKYSEARAVLKTIDHPTAREWEERLDTIDAPFTPPAFNAPASNAATIAPSVSQKPPKKSIFTRKNLLIVVVVWVILALINNRSEPTSISRPIATQNPTEIAAQNTKSAADKAAQSTKSAAEAAAQSTKSAAEVAAQSTKSAAEIVAQNTKSAADKAAFNATATIIALTPSATITKTPLPSLTPTPVPTDIPPTEVQGTKGNPYPPKQEGGIRDGRFRVNQILRKQTANVKNMNMFNEDPPAGGEYVLANVTFFCDLPGDKTCNVSAMNIELIGKNGTAYKSKMFIVLKNPFSGEVFGGGETTGDVAFTVNSNDAQFVVAVNDLGSRMFFAGNQAN